MPMLACGVWVQPAGLVSRLSEQTVGSQPLLCLIRAWRTRLDSTHAMRSAEGWLREAERLSRERRHGSLPVMGPYRDLVELVQTCPAMLRVRIAFRRRQVPPLVMQRSSDALQVVPESDVFLHRRAVVAVDQRASTLPAATSCPETVRRPYVAVQAEQP